MITKRDIYTQWKYGNWRNGIRKIKTKTMMPWAIIKEKKHQKDLATLRMNQMYPGGAFFINRKD